MGASVIAAASQPVTDVGPRILLTLGVLLVIALGVWGMRHGWAAREARQADLPAPAQPPADLSPVDPVPGLYVATTMAGDLLDRVVAHGLGIRGRATLDVTPHGVSVLRVGETPIWIPTEDLRDVRLGSGQAQKAFEAGGLILLTWALGEHLVETGFRADDPEAHVATATVLSTLVATTGGRP